MPAYFGLDVGSTSIKVLQSSGSHVKVVGIGPNPIGKSISGMSNTEKIALTDFLKKLIKDVGMREKKVVASIPEASVFSRVMKFPVMSTPELATAIKWELEQSVPFPPSEVETSWAILDKPEKFAGDEKITVYVVAVPSHISETYVQILELIGLEVLRLENEIPALVRSFAGSLSDTGPSVLLDMGSGGTNIVIAGKTKIFGNYYIPVGGSALTKVIADSFGLPLDQAENYKRTYGFSKDQLDGKMVTVLKPIIDNMIGEVKKLIITFKDEHQGQVVSKVVLTGGGAYLTGIIPYLSEVLGVEAVIGDTFSNMSVDAKYKNLGPVFSIANGLALEI